MENTNNSDGGEIKADIANIYFIANETTLSKKIKVLNLVVFYHLNIVDSPALYAHTPYQSHCHFDYHS